MEEDKTFEDFLDEVAKEMGFSKGYDELYGYSLRIGAEYTHRCNAEGGVRYGRYMEQKGKAEGWVKGFKDGVYEEAGVFPNISNIPPNPYNHDN